MIRKYIVLLAIGLSFGTCVLGMHEFVFMGRVKRPEINSECLWKHRQTGRSYSETYCTFNLDSFIEKCSKWSEGVIYASEDEDNIPDKFKDLELEYFQREAQKETSKEVVTHATSSLEEVSYQVGSDEDCRLCFKKSDEEPECWRIVSAQKMKINPVLYYAFKQMHNNQQRDK